MHAPQRDAYASAHAAPPANPLPIPCQATKTLKIGTRGSPLALAQAYLTRDLLKARARLHASTLLGVHVAGARAQRLARPQRRLAPLSPRPARSRSPRPSRPLGPPRFPARRRRSRSCRRRARWRSSSLRPPATRSSTSRCPTLAARACSPRRRAPGGPPGRVRRFAGRARAGWAARARAGPGGAAGRRPRPAPRLLPLTASPCPPPRPPCDPARRSTTPCWTAASTLRCTA